jgi:hypothetical protein
MAYDAILDGKTGLMSAMVNGCYDLVPFPDPRLGPRKADVATMYNTERYRPIYVNKVLPQIRRRIAREGRDRLSSTSHATAGLPASSPLLYYQVKLGGLSTERLG